MKMLVIVLLALGSISAFAGTLVNERTNEEIVFTLNRANRVVGIRGSYDGNIRVKDLTKKELTYFGISSLLLDEGTAFMFFTAGTAIIVTGVADTVSAPFIALKEARIKKDYRLLMSMVNSNSVLKVKDRKFNRILEYLLQYE